VVTFLKREGRICWDYRSKKTLLSSEKCVLGGTKHARMRKSSVSGLGCMETRSTGFAPRGLSHRPTSKKKDLWAGEEAEGKECRPRGDRGASRRREGIFKVEGHRIWGRQREYFKLEGGSYFLQKKWDQWAT